MMEKILKEVLTDSKPSQEEKEALQTKIDNFIVKINKNIKDAKAILGGSGAKDTWLKGAHDADIFVKFNYSKYQDKSEQLSDILEKHLKKIFKYKRLHGSRDYFQINEKGFIFEVVPILDIKTAQQAKNITDVSPLHSQWVNKYPKLKDEIRLTKSFCKAQSVYGAESYIQGFSGYICEVLTIYFGSFLKLVKAATQWKDKVIIDVAKYYKNEDAILFEVNKAKLFSPLILIDPVQKDRNAAAAMSFEKFDQFRKACQVFLRKPAKSFFEKKEITIEELKKRAKGNKLIIAQVIPLDGKEDVVGSKLLKAFTFLHKRLPEKEFKVIESGWKWDKAFDCVFWFIFDKKPLPETETRIGPPSFAKEHIAIFKKKHKNVYLKNRRYYAKVKRTYRTPEQLLKDIIKDKYLKDKVKAIKWIL